MPPPPLTNFETKRYYQNETKFNGVYSRDNLPDEIKDGAYVINLDEYSDNGTHWVALYAYNDNVTFFNYFDKSLIVLSVTAGSISIASFATLQLLLELL